MKMKRFVLLVGVVVAVIALFVANESKASEHEVDFVVHTSI